MTNITANGIQIEYDTFGDRAAAPLLLVMGLGAQMIAWDPDFCGQLADAGHHVIRFDNRDVGLSTKFGHRGSPDMLAAIAARDAGRAIDDPPYLLSDMADDAAGLLYALAIPAAHIVGASMGGMIVQAMAVQHPACVLTMTSIMSTTGDPGLPPAKAEALAMLTRPAAPEREARIAQGVESAKVNGSPGFPFDEAKIRERAGLAYDRCFYPEGMARQMVAIIASGSRREALRGVRAPTLVIHGAADPLVPAEGGKDTAAAIPGAELLIIEGMGHDLPRGAWPVMIDAITRLTSRVPARV